MKDERSHPALPGKPLHSYDFGEVTPSASFAFGGCLYGREGIVAQIVPNETLGNERSRLAPDAEVRGDFLWKLLLVVLPEI